MSSDEVISIFTGNEGCQCTNTSNVLSSLVERSCQTSDGQNGVMLSAEGPCVNYSYGSSSCLQHDLIHDPKCQPTRSGGANYPDYCIRPFCYVDAKSCMRSSSERVFRSSYFPSGVDVFYSYTTCDSSADDWMNYDSGRDALGGIQIAAAFPAYVLPFMYKTSPAGDILTSMGSEYYNESVPYYGILPTFMDSLQQIAGGDFNVTYTYGSKASQTLHPTSIFTAAIQDIKDGLVDMAVGPYWVTGDRLKMASFTIPFLIDKTVLVIPKPGMKTSLSAQTSKVLAPFTMGVWALILAAITLTALLSVWFYDRSTVAKERFNGKFWQSKRPGGIRKRVYARLVLDEFLRKGIFFCSAGVEQDTSANLSHKLLMFGFGFFILIVVSAYVANLAAFLTQSTPDFVGTMAAVVEERMTICAHPVLQSPLEILWPRANFVFSQAGKEYIGFLDDYDAGKCDVMAVSLVDTSGDIELMNMFCERGLVFTESLVIDNPVAFPIKAELGSGMSYWMYEAERYHGITFEAAQEEYDSVHSRQIACSVDFSVRDEPSEYTQIAANNLFFPIMFFVAFACVAICLQIFYQRALRKGRGQLLLAGRRSKLNLFSGEDFKIPPSLEKNSSTSDCNEHNSSVSNFACTDDVDKENGVHQASNYATNYAISVATGSFLPTESVQVDGFHCNEQNVKKRVKFLNSEDDDTTLQLQTLADELLACVQKIKEQKDL